MPTNEQSPPKQGIKEHRAAGVKQDGKPKPEWFEARNKGGQTAIKIYPLKQRAGFVFRYYVGGKSRTVERVDRDKAIAEALRIAAGIDAGLAQTGKLTAADMESYVHAVDQLPPDSPPLHAIVAEWVAFRREIGATPLSEVLAVWKRAGRRQSVSPGSAPTVERLAVEFIAALAARTRPTDSQRNLDEFRWDLPRFGKTFGHRPIAEIRLDEIEKWLRGLGVGARRQDNLRGELVTFFRWARDRGHLDEDRRTEPEKLGRVDKRNGEVEHWRPAELRTLLAAVGEPWLPCLVLAAFAGLRTSEIGRLNWNAFDWTAGRIYVRASVAVKTSRSRRVPIEPNLAAWLLPWRNAQGRLYEYSYFTQEWSAETTRLEAATGLEWRRNNLRHSYGTYQMALTDNYNQVSAWMGNSPGKVQSNYDGVATPKEAGEWFSVQPDGTKKVVPMRAAE